MQLDDWQTKVVQEIGIAMIHLIPDGWDTGSIVLEPTEKGLGNGLQHSPIVRQQARSSLNNSDFVLPDSAVMAATRKLELGLVKRKCTFQRAIITVTRQGEDWNVQSSYD